MKTTKTIKERLIKISRNEKIYLGIKMLPLIMILICAVITKLIPKGPVHLLLYFLFFPVSSVFSSTIKAIKRKDEKIIQQNKLINVILSDGSTVADYFLFLLFCPLTMGMLVIYGDMPFWIFPLILFVITFCSFKLGEIISGHFKDKLFK